MNGSCKKPSHEAGFTLVEVMTVLVIIGLMSGAVIMTLPDYTPPEETMAQAMHVQLNNVSEDSLTSGEPKAFALSTQSYALYNYRDTQWVSAHTQNWPEGMAVRLTKDGTRVELKSKLAPLVTFDPTGLSSVFDLTLSGDNRSFCLSSSGDGRVTLGYEPCPT